MCSGLAAQLCPECIQKARGHLPPGSLPGLWVSSPLDVAVNKGRLSYMTERKARVRPPSECLTSNGVLSTESEELGLEIQRS